MIRAQRVRRTKRDPDSNIEKILDLGFVGEPEELDPIILHNLIDSDIIPVIAPIGLGPGGETYNINADTVAGAVAVAVKAARLLMLTDVSGVLDKEGKLIADIGTNEAVKLIEDGTISGGMIPKIETCIAATEGGVEAAVILDGRTRNALLLEPFTESGVGTAIWRPDIDE